MIYHPLTGLGLQHFISIVSTMRRGQLARMKSEYLNSITLVERLHRQFLEVLKVELDHLGIQGINNVQALILYNLGDEEMTVGELTQRGYYLGTNVSYNLRKLVEAGYVEQFRSEHDRRTMRIRLSSMGLDLHQKLDKMFGRHVNELSGGVLQPEAMTHLDETLRGIEKFFSRIISGG